MRITANQVTLVRLALIPIPGWLLYHGVRGQYCALILATLLGCTDFIDGYLARKYGSTVLGSLMDPIADKVFTAVCFLPAVDLHWLPAWMVGALFVREFFVTAVRSIYERRDLSLRSSYLARYKTWVQMCGVGVLMLLGVAPAWFMDWFLAAGAVLPLVAFVVRYLMVRKTWKGAAAFTVSFTSFWVMHRLYGSTATATLLGYYIVGITWASGLGYFSSVGRLRGRGAATASDVVRLVTSVALPVVAILLQTTGRAPVWALIAVLALELAHGGLDNLLAHHKAEWGAGPWGLRLATECALLAWGLAVPSVSTVAAYGAALTAVVGIVVAFVQKRRYYLEEKVAGALLDPSRAAAS